MVNPVMSEWFRTPQCLRTKQRSTHFVTSLGWPLPGVTSGIYQWSEFLTLTLIPSLHCCYPLVISVHIKTNFLLVSDCFLLGSTDIYFVSIFLLFFFFFLVGGPINGESVPFNFQAGCRVFNLQCFYSMLTVYFPRTVRYIRIRYYLLPC